MDELVKQLAPYAPLVIEEATKFVLKKTNPSSPAGELAKATTENNIRNVQSALEKDPFIDRGPALVAASSAGFLSILDLLIEPAPPLKHHRRQQEDAQPQKIDLNLDYAGLTPLLAAIKNKHRKTARTLLEAGAKPNFAPKGGPTPLQQATQSEDRDMVEILLSFGADPNRQNALGDTPLIIAARSGSADIARTLLEKGADVDKRNAKWSTPLHVAARHDAVGVMEVLLEYGADARAKDKKSRSPLHRAVAGSWIVEGVPTRVKEKMVRMLIRAGANPGSKDWEGKTAAQRVSWLTGGEGLRKLLEGRSRSIEHTPGNRAQRSKTF